MQDYCCIHKFDEKGSLPRYPVKSGLFSATRYEDFPEFSAFFDKEHKQFFERIKTPARYICKECAQKLPSKLVPADFLNGVEIPWFYFW